MVDKKADDQVEETQPVEDPEEVAAREAGNNATLTVVDTTDDDSDSDSDADENPGAHVPHTEYAREV